MIQVGGLQVSLEDKTVLRAGAQYPLNRRAFAILEALIAARGTLVSKDALLDYAWPDAIVEENNLQVQIVALRRALGHSRDLIRTVSGRGYILLPQPPEAPRQSAVYSLGLPLVDTLFGRSTAVEDLLEAFQSNQIVTLTGPGGIGKTSLAVELCRHTGYRFRCIRYVSLAALQNARQVNEAVLAIFADVVKGSAITIDELGDSLRNAKCLVILDNCEHLIGTVAHVAQAISAGNGGVRVIATSREALRIAGETVVPVQSLTVPEQSTGPEAALECDAVQLFLHRLHRAAADFKVDDATVAIVGEICRRLDGIPLAIELAAARASTLGLELVRAHLDDRFAVLTGGSRDVLPRHQTLRAVFDWSYRLLSKTEQTLFRQSSVFVDGFSFDAIVAIMNERGIDSAETAQCLAGLVAKSLVYVDRKHGRRFRHLESTRAYAKSLLDNEGETTAASHWHAKYFRDFFSGDLYRSDAIAIDQAHHLISAEIGNMREAMVWALGLPETSELGINLAATAVPMLLELPLYDECCHWGAIALQAIENSPRKSSCVKTQLTILSAYASALVYTDGPKSTVEHAWRQALTLAEAQMDHRQQLRAIQGLWKQKQYAGDMNEALICAGWYQATAKRIGSPQEAALSRQFTGITLHYLGKHAEAHDELEAALSTSEMQTPNGSTAAIRTDQTATTQAALARVKWFLGDRRASLQTVETAEEMAQSGAHGLTLAYIFIEVSIPLAILQRDPDLLMLAIESLQKECRSAGLRAWLKCCDAFEWIAKSMEGSLSLLDLTDMEAAIDRLRETEYLAPLPLVLGEFANALYSNGQCDRAAKVIDDALAYCRQCGSGWYQAALVAFKQSITHAGIDPIA